MHDDFMPIDSEGWSASMAMGTGCCGTADTRACSLSVDTPLFPVTLPWASPTVQLEALQVPFLSMRPQLQRNRPCHNPRAVARSTATNRGDEPNRPWR